MSSDKSQFGIEAGRLDRRKLDNAYKSWISLGPLTQLSELNNL